MTFEPRFGHNNPTYEPTAFTQKWSYENNPAFFRVYGEKNGSEQHQRQLKEIKEFLLMKYLNNR